MEKVRATFWLRERGEIPGSMWRVLVPARHLPAHVRVVGDGIGPHPQDTAAIFVKPTGTEELDAIRSALQRGLRVCVEVDDDWMGINPRLLALRGLAILRGLGIDITPAFLEWRALENQGYFEGYFNLHREAVRAADAVIVSTEELALSYRRLNRNIFLCPYSLDPVDWPAELRARNSRETFTIGFAGSTSHTDDVLLIRDALEWAGRQEGLEARFIGWDPREVIPTSELEALRATFEELLERERDPFAAFSAKLNSRDPGKWSFPITVVPWRQDLPTYRDNLASLDVGLCPINDESPFTYGRSDSKVLEFAAAGALPIVSDSPVYGQWKGILPMARSSAEFLELVQWAATHRVQVRERARRVWLHISATRTIDTAIRCWRQAAGLPGWA